MILFSVAGASTSIADIEVNTGLTSNYLWRGVTQSDDGAAISGGLDYEQGSGFFAGAWVSSVDFADADGSQMERDLYVGFANDVGGLAYSVMYSRYTYSESKDADFGELLVGLSYGQFSGGIAYAVDSDVADSPTAKFVKGDAYYHLAAEMALVEGWTVSLLAGYYDFDNDGAGNAFSYVHYQLDLARSVGKMGSVTFSLSQADDESGDDDLNAVLSWSKSF